MTTSDPRANAEALKEIRTLGSALDRLLTEPGTLEALEEAVRIGDVARFRKVAETAGVADRLDILCRWVCTWHVQRICFRVCRDQPMADISDDEAREATIAFGKLAATDGALERLVKALDQPEDAAPFHDLLKQFGLDRWCRLICVLVLTVRCELFCSRLGDPTTRSDLVVSLRNLATATARLAQQRDEFDAVIAAYGRGDITTVQAILNRLDFLKFCRLFCWWLCILVPFLRCLRICLKFPPELFVPVFEPRDPGPIREWAQVVRDLAADEKRVQLLLRPALAGADDEVVEAVRTLDLLRWCPYLCFWVYRVICLRFCRLLCPPRPPLPYFYKLGGYDYTIQVDAGSAGTGLTNDNRAFFSTVRLNGSDLQKQFNAGNPEYRFEVRAPGSAVWNPVLAAQIAPTVIGSFTRVGLITPKSYVVNGSGGPNEITIPVAPDGWIAVPTADNYFGLEGYFSSNGDYLSLITPTLAVWPVHDVTSVDAGEEVPVTEQGADRKFGIRMRWRRIGDSGDGIDVGTAENVAIINDTWDNVEKLGSWVPTRVDGQLAVVSVDIDEIGGGCADVHDQLHVRYTAAHPNLGAVSMSLTGPGSFGLTMVDDGSATATNRFGVAQVSAPKTAADLFNCTYVVTISATILVTTGDGVPDPVQDTVAFHKS